MQCFHEIGPRGTLQILLGTETPRETHGVSCVFFLLSGFLFFLFSILRRIWLLLGYVMSPGGYVIPTGYTMSIGYVMWILFGYVTDFPFRISGHVFAGFCTL